MPLWAQRLVETRVYRGVRYRLSRGLLALSGNEFLSAKEFANTGIPAAALAYFPDGPQRAYQIEQWLPVFEKLHVRHPVLVVTRSLATFDLLQERTHLPLVYARQLADVEDVLERTDPKVCLYVNNAASNFQVLSWRRALHVHLNHGESDKISMASNQAKAYDAVLVAGEAAEVRYRANLLGFEGSNLVRIGRPQLDLEYPYALPASERWTILYAPTWEGDTAAMNYSSMPRFGPGIVRALADGGFRVVYKPHPRIVTGSNPVVAAHKAIVRTLEAANEGLPRNDRHVVELEAPIIPLFRACAAMVCDVSSVAVDWLYLRTDAPLWICDPREDRKALLESSPLTEHAYVLDGGVMPDVVARLRESIADDPRRGEREESRRFYFGELAPGESTRRFLDTIDDLVARRDALLAAKTEAPGLDVASGVA